MTREVPQVTPKETDIILELISNCLDLDGDIVEFGCYKGDTSLLIQKLLKNNGSKKTLWIYDSFEGLPERTSEDDSVAGEEFKAGELLVTKREVVERFKKAGLQVPKVKKGFFEDLNPELDVPGKIAFAFLDGDLYRSIKSSLKLVTPKMTPGGVIVVHDYNRPALPGSARAVDEWRSNKNVQLSVRETLAIIKV